MKVGSIMRRLFNSQLYVSPDKWVISIFWPNYFSLNIEVMTPKHVSPRTLPKPQYSMHEKIFDLDLSHDLQAEMPRLNDLQTTLMLLLWDHTPTPSRKMSKYHDQTTFFDQTTSESVYLKHTCIEGPHARKLPKVKLSLMFKCSFL